MIVVARCRRCRGWTMFHADAESAAGIEWTAMARASGDLITTYEPSEDIVLGSCCPDTSGKPPLHRICPVTMIDEPAWSYYP